MSVAIWALCWRCDRPHRWHRIRYSDNTVRCSGDGFGRCKSYSYRLCDVCESRCHRCGEYHQESLMVVWGSHQDCSSPAQLWLSTCLHFSGKWIIPMIVFMYDIGHQFLAMITCTHLAIVYYIQTSIDPNYGFRTQSTTEIRNMVAWLLANDRFTCPTNVHEWSSKFPGCLIVVLKINLKMQVSNCSGWNCGCYSLDILRWHMTNWNERLIIEW